MLLLAGLQSIDPALDEAARLDGAGAVRQFITITLPLLRPALVVAVAFRMLDALRVFDLVYVLTGGGPGTATEPLSLYAFIALTAASALRLRLGALGHRLPRDVSCSRSCGCVCSGRSLIGERA